MSGMYKKLDLEWKIFLIRAFNISKLKAWKKSENNNALPIKSTNWKPHFEATTVGSRKVENDKTRFSTLLIVQFHIPNSLDNDLKLIQLPSGRDKQ